MNGYLVTGRDDTFESGNSIFLPAAGYCNGGDDYEQSYHGNYWSSTPNGSDRAYILHFNSDGQEVYNSKSNYGYSVRAVLAE